MSDTKLLVAIAILHLVALAAGGGLVMLALRGGDGYCHPHGEGRGGPEPPPDPPRRPNGGPPMPIARPARVRLREPARLADLHPPRQRRAPRAPKRPAPRPATNEPATRVNSPAQDTARP